EGVGRPGALGRVVPVGRPPRFGRVRVPHRTDEPGVTGGSKNRAGEIVTRGRGAAIFRTAGSRRVPRRDPPGPSDEGAGVGGAAITEETMKRFTGSVLMLAGVLSQVPAAHAQQWSVFGRRP